MLLIYLYIRKHEVSAFNHNTFRVNQQQQPPKKSAKVDGPQIAAPADQMPRGLPRMSVDLIGLLIMIKTDFDKTVYGRVYLYEEQTKTLILSKSKTFS